MSICSEEDEQDEKTDSSKAPFDYLEALHSALLHENDPVKRQQIEAGMVFKWLKEEPLPFLRQLRRERPIFANPALTLVTRYNDVVEVLNTNDVFTVDNIAPKLIEDVGQNILAMNDSPKYEKEKSLLRLAFPRADLPRYRQFVIEEANRLLTHVGIDRPFDLAGEYALKVPAAAMARYLGVGEIPTEKVVAWTHALFHDIFLNPTNDPAAVGAAQAARQEALPMIDAIIAARKKQLAQSPPPEQPSVMDRYLLMQSVPETYESDEGIRDVILGLLMGCVDLSGGAIVNVLVELMKRPRVLREALNVANVADDAAITGYVLEALRFRPPSVGVTSRCVREYTVGLGTHHQAKIPAGALVMACSASAMHDPEHIAAPDEFKPGRLASKNYLFWESGIHTCHGKYVAILHISIAVKQLLRAGVPNRIDPTPRHHGYPSAFRVRLAPVEG
ncbi:cytochrome P450 [Sorangium sp. So ce887]|uniref:cytochrome P450 n=1 Tax=Sorangium sp. So ce887 TaxID=3133324 RepID=UPI003F613080